MKKIFPKRKKKLWEGNKGLGQIIKAAATEAANENQSQ